ncbi:MAG: gliding motility-associated C-terminal domain-containing protein [Saprospiraceae bacterium]|nr:gliding motility-associated C-terminal domain-containing protein [Saprospiraceae bacterium]
MELALFPYRLPVLIRLCLLAWMLIAGLQSQLHACATPPQMSGIANICPGQTGDISVANAASYVGFAWSTGAATPTIQVSSPGTYVVTVTDAASCTATGSITVTSNTTITDISAAITPQSSCINVNGAVNITVDPVGAYTFAWSNGQSTEDLLNLIGERYTVTVTDAAGCTATALFIVPDNTAPPIFELNSSPTTCMQADGNIVLTMNPPTGNYTFQWSSGQTTQNILQVFPGPYSVTITNGNDGCTSLANTTLANTNFVPQVTGMVTPNNGCSGGNGSISLEVEPDVVTYTYNWSNGGTGPVLSDLTGGSYTVTVTHGVVCTAVVTFEIINVPTQIDVQGASTPELCGTSNGEVDITPTPFGIYNYQWSNGATAQDLTGVQAGSYTVTVSSGNSNCTATATFFVGDQSLGFSFSEQMTANTKCANFNGTLNIDVSPPGNYTYAWSNGASTQDINHLQGGAYTVTVSYGNGCTGEASFTVDDALEHPTVIYNVSLSSCGLSNGAIDLFLDPPAGNSFSWTNGANSEDLNNLQAGNYGVTVTAQNGCTTTDIITVQNAGANFTLAATTAANTACTGANGAVNLTVTPTGSYTYTWSNGAASQNLANVAAGSYTVTVSAGGNCTAIASYTVPNNSGAPSLVAIFSSATCGTANGSVNLTVSPSGSYGFAWSNGASTEDLATIAPGSYTVTVTGVNGCTSSTSVQVQNSTPSLPLSGIAMPNSSCQLPNGSIDLSIGQTGSFTYQWSNGASSEDLQNIAAGTYTVTVTQGVNCTATASYDVSNNTPAPVLTATPMPATCGLPTGSIDLSVSPGTGNSFSWTSGASSEDLQNLPPGTYTVTVTGANGCSATTSINVADTPAAINPTGISIPNTSCTLPNGSIDLSVAQPGNFNYQWSTGATTEDLQNLAPGNYAVTVTLGSTCSISADFTVENDSPAPLLAGIAVAATCGQANGEIDLTITASIGTDLLWSNGLTTEDLAGLAPGSYTVTVTAGNGCSAMASIQVTNLNSNFSLVAASMASSSCVSPNGQVQLNVSPSGSYDYLWSNGAMSQNLQNVPAGNYSVTVTDASGCSDIETATVTGAVQPTVAVTGPAAVCAATAAVLQADAGFSNYAWSNGPTSQTNTVAQPGNYFVTATDANGCSATASFTVGTLPAPTPSIAGPTAICVGGSADFTVGGGVFNQIIWSNGATASNIIVSQAGTYAVTVTDANGCTGIASQNLSIGNSLLPAIALDVDGCAQTALLDAGVGYTNYLWSNGATGQILNVSAPGNYTVTVSDGSGCTGEDAATVSFPTLLQVQISGASAICLGASTQFSVPNIYPQILWNTGETTPAILASQPGSYAVTITDTNGCTAIDDHLLTVGGSLVPDIAPAPPTCDGTAVLDAGPGYATYLWSNGLTSQTVTVTAAGTYSVTVSDSPSGGCSGSASEAVNFPSPPQVQINGAENLCEGDVTDLAATGNFVQYLWSTGEVAPQISISQGGSYAVTVTNAQGCTATNSWSVAQLFDAVTYLQTVSCDPLDTGTVETFFTTLAGCDSMVVTTTTLSQPITGSLELLVCEGELAIYNGVGIPVGGSHEFVFTAAKGCDSIVTVSVAALPAVSFVLLASITCWNKSEGQIQVEMMGGTEPFQYAIDGGAPYGFPAFVQLSGGPHTVVVEDANGCKHAEDIVVPQTNQSILMVEDAIIPCPEGKANIQPILLADHPEAVVWTWTTGSNLPETEITDEGIYGVEVDDGCEVISREFTVEWDEEYHRNEFFYVPNSFSPNDDAYNDEFLAYKVPSVDLLSYEMHVFDRWGAEMFYSNAIDWGWNGKYRGEHMQPGVYAWFIKAKVLVCGLREVEVFLKGGVTVMR